MMRPDLDTFSSSGLPSTTEIWKYWKKSNRCPPRSWEWSTSMRKGGENWVWRRGGSRGSPQYPQFPEGRVPRSWNQALLNSAQCQNQRRWAHSRFPLNTRSSSVLCEWWSVDIGFPETVESPWGSSKAAWTWPWVSLLEHGWANLPPEVLSSLSHSVILWSGLK